MQQQGLSALPKLQELFETIEMPLVKVLWQMEKTGILLDTKQLHYVGEGLEAAIIQVADEIKKRSGA